MSPSSAPAGRPSERIVWINGRLCRGADATLSLFDRGARDGEGLFETLRVESGVPHDWERHMERLVLSAAELGFPVPASPARLRAAIDELVEATKLTEGVARVTVTRGMPGGRPTRTGAWVEIESLTARLWSAARPPRATAVFSRRPFETGPLGRHKTTSRLAYSLAREEARVARADEAILVSPGATVLEGATSNLFAVIGGAVLTPPLSLGILPGIARAHVLRLCADLGLEGREQLLTRAEVAAADEVFLTNSVQEVAPLAALAGRGLPSQALGDRLAIAYRAMAGGRARGG